MYISKVELHNFKGFKGDHAINFDVGVNLLDYRGFYKSTGA